MDDERSLGSLGSLGDLKPRPDPSVLTTQQLVREIAALKEVMGGRVDSLDRIMQAGFESAKEAVGKAEFAVNTRINSTDSKIDDLKQRITLIEGRSEGGEKVQASSTAQSNWAVGTAVVILVALIEMVSHFIK